MAMQFVFVKIYDFLEIQPLIDFFISDFNNCGTPDFSIPACPKYAVTLNVLAPSRNFDNHFM